MGEPSFSVVVLEQLRAGRYRPRAWWRMLTDSWTMARSTAGTHPNLARHWRLLSGELGVMTCCFLVYTARRHGRAAMLRSTFPLIAMLFAQVGDIYVHLGLHRDSSGGLHRELGAAMSLTALRSWSGAAACSRLLAGMPLTDDESFAALLIILATDIADGRLSRRDRLASPLGRYLDGEADMLGWSALTLTQVRRGQISPWYLLAFGLRWGLPLVAALSSSFARADPVTFTPSRLGKTAGGAQVALAATALFASMRSNAADSRFWSGLRTSLVGVTSGLLVAATIRHVTRLLGQ